MNTIIERITEAIKDILIGLIKSCLDNMFTSVNEQVGTIAGQVGQTPQGWNGSVFSLIKNLSETVMVPIAGMECRNLQSDPEHFPNGDCPHCGTDHHICPVL